MKEVMHIAANFMLVPVEPPVSDEITGHCEIAITVSEPTYRTDAGGVMCRTRDVETIRFSTSAPGLRSLAKTFTEWADELADFCDRHQPETTKETPGDGQPSEAS